MSEKPSMGWGNDLHSEQNFIDAAGSSADVGAFLRRHRMLSVLGLAVLYFLTGRLGLELAHYQSNATLVWPPTGLSLASLILFGRWLWPGVFLGAAAVNLYVGTDWAPALAISVGNALEAIVGALCLERFTRFRSSLSRVRDVVAFLAIGVAACTLVSATIGVSSLFLSGDVAPRDFGVVWLIWWLGDAGGALVVAPLILLGRQGIPAWKALVRRVETWVVLALLVAGTAVPFGGPLDGPWALLATFLPFPFLAWAGARLGPRGAVSAAFVTSVVAVLGTAQGHGPFHLESTHASLLLLWTYVTSIAAAALALAAAIAEREFAEAAHRREEEGRRRLERKMRQAQRLESLGLLAGGVAHDFNNILAAIRGFAELLREKVDHESNQANMLEQIDLAVVRAAELCQHLLVYAGRSPPARTAVKIPELLGELRTLLGASVSKKVALEIEASKDTPAVHGDATLVRQLLLNLVFNGVEAIGDREGAVTVTTSTAELTAADIERLAGASKATPGRFICVEVSDTGQGMDAETMERVFDPFFSTKFTGRGLGLASALGIARSHRGAIDISSTPGLGTTFRVFLRPHFDEMEKADAPEPERTTERTESVTVLVADDEPCVLQVATIALERAGFRVIPAKNGREAVERFREHAGSIGAVLLDITMPKMGGVEVAAAIRDIAPGVPVVLMSGYHEESLAGAVKSEAFIHKPFSTDALVNRMRTAVAEGTTTRH